MPDLQPGLPGMWKRTLDMQVAPATAMAVLCVSGTALGELDLAWDGMTSFETVDYTYNDTFAWDSAARERNKFAFAGTLGFADSPLELLCIELQQDVTRDSVAYTTSPFDPSGPDYGRSRVLSSLFAQYYDPMVTSDDRAWAAAFAMMTWEIMSENFDSTPEEMIDRIDLDRGAVQFESYSSEALDYFDQMLSTLGVANDSSNLITYRNDDYQDFVGQVPAPGALALLAVSGLAVPRRRRS